MSPSVEKSPHCKNDFETLYSLAKACAGINETIVFDPKALPEITHSQPSIGTIQVRSLTVGESNSMSLEVTLKDGTQKKFLLSSDLFEKYSDLSELFTELKDRYTQTPLEEVFISPPKEPIKSAKLSDPDFANFAGKFPQALELLMSFTSYKDEDTAKKAKYTLVKTLSCLKHPEKSDDATMNSALHELRQDTQYHTATDLLGCISTSAITISKQRDALKAEDPALYFALATFILKQIGGIHSSLKLDSTQTLTVATSAYQQIHPLRDEAHALMSKLSL